MLGWAVLVLVTLPVGWVPSSSAAQRASITRHQEASRDFTHMPVITQTNIIRCSVSIYDPWVLCGARGQTCLMGF